MSWRVDVARDFANIHYADFFGITISEWMLGESVDDAEFNNRYRPWHSGQDNASENQSWQEQAAGERARKLSSDS